jgi:hypothetical protein
MKAHVFIISMLTGIVATYAVLFLGYFVTGRTLPTVEVLIIALVVGASAQQLSRLLMSNR